MTDLHCDFQAYLEQRFGKSPRATLDMLGDWLESYEPEQPTAVPRRPLRSTAPEEVTFVAASA